jgi:HD-GYP domain-containing protein (c-di-GMP phosphodiesterase class II)
MMQTPASSSNPLIHGLDAVAQSLSSDSRLLRCTVLRPHPLLVLVRRASRMVVVGPGSLWDRGRDVLGPYVSRMASGDAMLILVGRVEEPDLDRLINRGLASVLSAEPSGQALYVAIHNAFEMMESRGRAESRGRWLNRYRYELGELVEIARAMTTEREIDKLLDVILEKARFITGADAGSLYVVEGEEPDVARRVLRFKLTQNDSVHFDWREFTIPISAQSIAGATALSGHLTNIADVYELPPGTAYAVDRTFDDKIKYRSRSMLCAPLVNKAGEVIGVLQLINKKREPERRLLNPEDFEQQVVAFDERSEELLGTLAAHAGICMENALLYEDIRRIFEGFVRASVEAIEQRDPTTSGHSRRVAELSLTLARCVDRADTGPYRDVHFDAQDLRELEYASLLHDFGKIGVREKVLVKAKKLHESERAAIRLRLDFAIKSVEVDILKRKVERVRRDGAQSDLDSLDEEFKRRVDQIEEAWKLVLHANEPSVVMQNQDFARIDSVAKLLYSGPDGQLHPLLSEGELTSLKIARGSLNNSEIEEIRSHVTHTLRFLQRIPWGSSFRRIPSIAGAHHERLNGTGYPDHLHAEEIPLQSKIMSVADIFDALTANDRPYKPAVPVDRALAILDGEVRSHHIDVDLVRIFREAQVWESPLRQIR